ncbi:MAG TPA: alpha/beta hydrolase [Gammaproteobacteria bacterium]
MNTLFSLLAGLLLLNGMMYLLQPGMVFYPTAAINETPAEWQMPYEAANIDTADGKRLHVWYIPASVDSQTKPVLLFFHGNAGNISHRRASLEIFHQLGLNQLIIDYRGYGKSTGTPSEDGLYIDAMAAWDYLVDNKGFHADQIIVFGRSLGGSVAAQLASRVQPRGLILESSFSSARDVAQHTFPLLSHLLYLRYDFNSLERLTQISAPLLILHSPQDEIIPYESAEKLFNAAQQPKTFVQLRGDHNNGFYLSQPMYQQALADWLQGLHE